ncbi:unnamed protein product [Parajaminaea phylloscopi]
MWSRSTLFGSAIGSLSVALSLLPSVKADTFHLTGFNLGNVLAFNGSMTVPSKLTTGGTIYLWPGIQNDATVLQPVLDGRDNHWYWGNALVGNPSGPYGGGQSVVPGEKLSFFMVNKDGQGNWKIGSGNGAGNIVSYDYDINTQLQHAYFVSEIYEPAKWDFGDLVFNDCVVVAPGTDGGWCSRDTLINTASSVKVSVGDVHADVVGDTVHCHVQSLTLSPP